MFSYVLVLDDPNLPLVDFSKREIALSYLSELSRAARDQQADAQYIIDHPGEFYSEPTDLPKLAVEIKALSDFRANVQARAAECIRSAGTCETLEVPMPNPSVRPGRR